MTDTKAPSPTDPPITTVEDGGPRVRAVPDGDNMERLVCPDCGFVNYENPKIVVGTVAMWEGRVLLCRRNIMPRKGHWTIPAGYMELNETTEAGARREAMEEANADLADLQVLAIYNIPRISQVQIIYRGNLATPDVAAGPESQEVALFEWNDIPWHDLAFPSVHWALKHFDEVRGFDSHPPFGNPPGDFGDMTR
ncbi:NUDIX domain-containing protein [Hwanghaeella sp.]|uniref:NUDIX hydrolase n=1 Tax=Hwanghaeella sp. TaxID=2605943 RepID=UPI003CCBD3E2